MSGRDSICLCGQFQSDPKDASFVYCFAAMPGFSPIPENLSVIYLKKNLDASQSLSRDVPGPLSKVSAQNRCCALRIPSGYAAELHPKRLYF